MWKNKTSTVHVFLGETYAHVSDILTKLEKGNDLSDKDITDLKAKFGNNFKRILHIGTNDKVKYSDKVFMHDDTISIFRKRLCYYLNIKIPNNTYIWYEKDISHDNMFLHVFVHQVFKKETRIKYTTLQEAVANAFHITLPDGQYNMMDKVDAMSLLSTYSIKKVWEPLCFRYMYDGFIQYFPIDPNYSESTLTSDVHNSFQVHNNFAILLNNFDADNDMFHVIEKSSEHSTLYFPFEQQVPFTDTDKKFINTINKVEEELNGVEVLEMEHQKFVNYLHIKGNDHNLNKKINLETFFQHMPADASCPFIKFKTQTSIFYKVFPSSLPSISTEDIDKWTTIPSSRDDRVYVMMKLNYHNDAFCTFTIQDDLSYQVKFNFSVKAKEGIKRIESFFNVINNILEQLHQLFPNSYIPLIPPNILHESKENNIVRVLQIIFTNTTKCKSDIKYTNFSNIVNASFYPYFNVIENKDPSILHLQYKKVNNYTKMNNISAFIYHNITMSKEDLLKHLMFTFMISLDEAEKEYESWKITHAVEIEEKNNKVYFKSKSDNFVNIKIRTSSSLELRYLINGITDTHMYDKIHQLMSILLTMVIKTNRKKKVDEDKHKLVEEMEIHENADANAGLITFQDISEHLGLVTEDDADIDGLDDLLDLEDEFAALEKEFAEKEIVAAEQAPPSPLTIHESVKSKKESTFIRKSLGDADPTLFNYRKSDKTRQDYASKCAGHDERYPIVVNKQELERIEKEYPGATTGYVKTGSTKELYEKNFYICPKVWCPISRVTLSLEHLNQGKQCPGENETPYVFDTNYFKGKQRYPGFFPVGTHPNRLCIPCCFSKLPKKNVCTPNFEGQQETKETDDIPGEKKESDEILGNEKYIKGEHFYPLEQKRYGLLPTEMVQYFGFKKHGNRHDGTGLMTDSTLCLLRKGIKQSMQSFLDCIAQSIDNPKVQTHEDVVEQIVENLDVATYISLENGRIMKLFIDSSKSIYNGKDFVEFSAWFAKQARYIGIMHLENLKNQLDTMKEQYDPKSIFANELLREFMIYGSFMNFKKYIEDKNVVKEHGLLMDLIINHLPEVNIHGYNLLVFEYNIQTTKIAIDCYVNRNLKSKTDLRKPFLFLFKRGTYYEPIAYVDNSKNTLKSTLLYYYTKSNPSIRSVIQFYLSNCGNPMDVPSNEKLLLQLANMGYKAKSIVIDYGYKACGVVLEKNLYIPFVERDNIFFTRSVKYIYIDEVIHHMCTMKLETIKTIYDALYEQTKNIFYRISSIVQDDKRIIGLKINSEQTFVPLHVKGEDRTIFSHGLYIFLNVERDDERVKTLQNLYKDHDVIHNLEHQIQEYLNANPEKKTEIEFLTDPSNPFPDNFKRKRILSILQSITSSSKPLPLYLEKITDLITGHLQKSKYFVQRIRRFSTNEGEVLLDHNDVARGQLKELRLQFENPYKFMLYKVDQMTQSYITSFEDNQDAAFVSQDSTYKSLPVKFRKELPGFSIISADGSYSPTYILDAFIKISKLSGKDSLLTRESFMATLQRRLVEDFKEDKIASFTDNPWVKAYLKKRGKSSASIEGYLEIISLPTYYPSLYDVKLMAELAHVNLVISGRKTSKNPDGLEVLYNNAMFYVILSYNYDRDLVIDRFELFNKDNHVTFDIDMMGMSFINIIEKKLHSYEVEVDD